MSVPEFDSDWYQVHLERDDVVTLVLTPQTDVAVELDLAGKLEHHPGNRVSLI